MKKMKFTKRFLVALMALAMVFTSVPMTNVQAASTTAVKKIVVKANGSDVTKKTVSLEAGKTVKLKVAVTPSSAKKSVVFKSNKTAIAKVNAKGKVTAVKAGTAKITVTVVGKNNKKKSTNVKIKVTDQSQATPAPTVAPTPSPATAIKLPEGGQSITIDAGKGTPIVLENAQGKKIIYESSDTKVATVDENGIVVAIGPGTATITAKTEDGSESVTISVKVNATPVTSVELPKSVDITVKGTTNLEAIITPNNATDKTLTWTSSNENIATVVNGEVSGVAVGSAVITAKAANGVYAECVVNVKAKEVLVEGVSVEVTNPYKDGNGKVFENTALVGDDLNVLVRVISDGKPVGNDSVELSLKDYAGNMVGYYAAKAENNSSSNKMTTDVNGYAKFSISLKDMYNNLDAVSDYVQSIRVIAKESGSNKSSDPIYVRFASIDVSGINVVLPTNLEPSDNAAKYESGTHFTSSQNMCKTEEYVVTQQETSDDKDHKVYLDATPYIILPTTPETQKKGSWTYNVKNGASGPCTVYNSVTNKTTTVIVEEVPAGLNYITLYFDKVDLSRYTAMNIDVYDKETGACLYDRRVTKTEADNGTPNVQIEAQDNRESYIVVSLVSQGQVDTTHQGYILTKLEGDYDTNLVQDSYTEPIMNAVDWVDITEDAIEKYEAYSWSYAEAAKYLPNDTKYLNSNYKYSYIVPSFPRVGNALITVKDPNDKVLARFAYPSVNNGKNKNIIDKAPTNKNNRVAFNISDDEYTNGVGKVSQEGNTAIVDSRESGRTFLRATINVAGLDEDELNDQNGGVLYSSVQWSPVPEEDQELVADDYFAIEGQTVAIKAQLYDSNNQMKTDEDQTIKFMYGEENEIKPIVGTNVGSNVVVASVSKANGATDSKGQFTLSLKDITNDKYFSSIEKITAKAQGYRVKLSFVLEDGTEIPMINNSNIYWVDLGLSFVDSAVAADKPKRTTLFENAEGSIDKTSYYTVSETKGWEVGYQVVARSDKFQYTFPNEPDRFPTTIDTVDGVTPYVPAHEFLSMDGVDITYTHASREYDIVVDNNVAVMHNTKALSEKLSGGLKIPTGMGNKITFTYYNDEGELETAMNIGRGTANIAATKLQLPIQWTESGQKVNVFAPCTINQNTTRKVFVQVLDELNNPLVGKSVKYKVVGVNATASYDENKVDAYEDTTHPGMYYFELPKVIGMLGIVKECTINLYVEDDIIGDPIKIAYQDDPSEAFGLYVDDATYYAVKVDPDYNSMLVYFNHAMDLETDNNLPALNAGEFKLVDADGKPVEIVSAELLTNKDDVVKLTFKKALEDPTTEYTLSINKHTDEMGIDYLLTDIYGQILDAAIDDNEYTFIPAERK